MTQRGDSAFFGWTRPKRIARDVCANYGLLTERRGTTRTHARRDGQRTDLLRQTLRNAATRPKPESFAIDIRQHDGRDHVWIESIDTIAERPKDEGHIRFIRHQLQRALLDRGERIRGCLRGGFG